MQQRDFQGEMKAEFNKWQAETLFPTSQTPLPPNFAGIVRDAFAFQSPKSLGIPTPEYKRILSVTDGSYTLLDMGTMLFAIESRTADDYGVDMDQYLDYMDMVDVLVGLWREACAAKSVELKEKYEGLIAAQKEALMKERDAANTSLKDSAQYKLAKSGKKNKRVPIGKA